MHAAKDNLMVLGSRAGGDTLLQCRQWKERQAGLVTLRPCNKVKVGWPWPECVTLDPRDTTILMPWNENKLHNKYLSGWSALRQYQKLEIPGKLQQQVSYLVSWLCLSASFLNEYSSLAGQHDQQSHVWASTCTTCNLRRARCYKQANFGTNSH